MGLCYQRLESQPPVCSKDILYPFHTAPVLGNAGVHFGRMGRCQYGPAIMPWQCPIVQEHFISIFSAVCWLIRQVILIDWSSSCLVRRELCSFLSCTLGSVARSLFLMILWYWSQMIFLAFPSLLDQGHVPWLLGCQSLFYSFFSTSTVSPCRYIALLCFIALSTSYLTIFLHPFLFSSLIRMNWTSCVFSTRDSLFLLSSTWYKGSCSHHFLQSLQ